MTVEMDLISLLLTLCQKSCLLSLQSGLLLLLPNKHFIMNVTKGQDASHAFISP
ncbi:Hypothetical protein SMAX5B_018136 [Scophthalmus maximus]|uniref:Uncharacterized protein n=1 Tax=Scophthalmus maximus TaxID=52904 RepID=A0A2U9CGH7_SCOMX|nr:Hypothetical protein SMAX5B_018136 [Scophthalmus maximus]